MDNRHPFKLPNKERLSPNYARKISDMLLEFGQEIAPPDSADETFSAGVDFAVLLWNMPLMPDDLRAQAMDRLRELLALTGQLELQTEIARLLDLRQTPYGADRRMIIDSKLEHEAKGPRLSVASLDMDRPEERRP
jgi:hypothetical protein